MAHFTNTDPESGDKMRFFRGSVQVDQLIRQAIQLAWMALPEERKTVEEVERVIRHIVERALKNYREDGETFGFGE